MRDFPFPALVLAGGLATRLAGVVTDLPKSMAPVAGRPFAEWLVEALAEQGARQIVFCTGHLHDAIERHFGAGSAFGVEIRYSREDPSAPLGTGGALRLAASRESGAERFFVVNGDSLSAFDLALLARVHAEKGARATLWTVPAEDASRYGSVVAEPDGRVVGFLEKTSQRRPNAESGGGLDRAAHRDDPDRAAHRGDPIRVNAGVGLFEREVLLAVPNGRAVSLETEILPSLVGRGLWAVFGDGPLLDIGTPESYSSAERVLASLRGGAREGSRRFVLLDRDGTVIVERNYLSDPEEVALTEGAGEALARLARRGLGLVLVTNQSAVGRGLLDLDRLTEIHAALANHLSPHGVTLDGIYVCPHRPDEGCACRKPGTELVRRAARELGFDPERAFVVGDKASDVELGRAVGAATVLVRTGYGREVEGSSETRPDHVADDLRGAATWIEGRLDDDEQEKEEIAR